MAEGALLQADFFDRDACQVARELLGTVLRHRVDGCWLAARLIEIEAYYLEDKASHSSLGRTPSREPMFMAPGTLYLYYSRAGDSLNFSVKGAGNAVLVKAGVPVVDALSPPLCLERMQALNPRRDGGERLVERLCSGQTLLCRSLGLRVKEWNGLSLDPERLRLERHPSGRPPTIVQARRLGISEGRDEDLLYRFVHGDYLRQATANPLTRRSWREGRDYLIS